MFELYTHYAVLKISVRFWQSKMCCCNLHKRYHYQF